MLPDGGAKLLHPNWDKNQAVKRHQLHLLKRGRECKHGQVFALKLLNQMGQNKTMHDNQDYQTQYSGRITVYITVLIIAYTAFMNRFK